MLQNISSAGEIWMLYIWNNTLQGPSSLKDGVLLSPYIPPLEKSPAIQLGTGVGKTNLNNAIHWILCSFTNYVIHPLKNWLRKDN